MQVQDVGSIINIIDTNKYTNIECFISIDDNSCGEINTLSFKKEFRWSKDNCQWSDYIELTLNNLNSLPIKLDDIIYFQYKYTLIGNNTDFNVLSISSVNLGIKYYKDDDPYKKYRNIKNNFNCSLDDSNIDKQYLNSFNPILSDCNSNFNFYNSNKNLQQELSTVVNSSFGHDVKYYISSPIDNDIILKQWTLSKVEPCKDFKVIVPNNEFPDSQFKFDPFGINFETGFEVHIDKKYFHDVFGLNKEPQKGDILYFTSINNNRIYEVHSTYLFNLYNGNPLYYKLSLIKYEPSLSRNEEDVNIQDLTLSFDDVFQQQREDIFKDKAKPLQYSIDNLQRTLLDKTIVNNNIIRNGNIQVSSHLFNLSNTLPYNSLKVSYNAKINTSDNDNFSLVFWFNKTRSTNKLLRVFGNDDNFNLYNDSNGFKLSYLGTDYNIPYISPINTWQTLVLNINNILGEIIFTILTPNGIRSAKHDITYNKRFNINTPNYSQIKDLGFWTSNFLVTNLRMFKYILNEEHWNLVLNQYIVKDSSNLILVDNMQPNYKLNKISSTL